MKVNFKKLDGLVPAVIQDFETLEVLMVGFMNEEALARTIADQRVTFFSRTKGRLWQKGETSGNFLEVVDMKVDCDEDSLLVLVRPVGPTCHEGVESCFGRGGLNLLKLFRLIGKRKKEMAVGSYTASLLAGGLPGILAKVEEESAEVVKAALGEGKQRLTEESCDLLYHLFVLLISEEIGMDELEQELGKRNG